MQASTSAAQREVKHLLRNYPRPHPQDMAQEVFAMNPSKARARLLLQLRGAPLQCAEIGSTAPNAYTRCFYDNSRLVMLNTGLVDFVRAVCRVLFANTHIKIGNDPTLPAALAPASAAQRLAALYTAWQSGGIWHEEKLEATPTELQAIADQDAELLTRAALLFTLSHELGHAVLHYEKLSVDAPTPLSQADELQADQFGIELAMTGWGDAGQKNWRMAAAGAMVALRIFSGLQRMGHVFPGDHPPPEQRLDKLRDNLRHLAVTEEGYYHITTIAIAEEEQMEGAERIIAGAGEKTEQTPERIVSGVCAALEQARKLSWPPDQLAAEFAERLQDASDAALDQAGRIMGRILSPRSPWYAESADRRIMVDSLASQMPTLPAALSRAYAAAP